MAEQEVTDLQVHNITGDLQPLATPIASLLPDPSNANTHPPEQLRELAASLTKYGQLTPLVVTAKDNIIRKGNGTWEAAFTLLGWTHIAAVFVNIDETTATGYSIADNRTAQLSIWDTDTLARLLRGFDEPLEIPGVDADWLASLPGVDLSELTGEAAESGTERQEAAKNKLTEKFIVPPFSVLDSRQGYWLDRKRNWLGLGIQSELGRGTAPGGSLLPAADYSDQQRGDGTGKPILFQGSQARLNELMGSAGFQTGASVFDPVLCELAYRWYSPVDGTVLDPFAGGSVRGIVAGMLGRYYTGIDLSERQVEANRQQVAEIIGNQLLEAAPVSPDAARQLNDPAALTPIDQVGEYWVKRDDLFSMNGARGGKVRTCYQLAQKATKGLVTAGARKSPQVLIVAKLAQQLGLKARLHVPSGKLTPELEQAAAAGGELIQHKPGYNSVIIARAREDAATLGAGWQLIPFGMETDYAVAATAAQVTNIPAGVKRIVVPVGSGMSLAGVLVGLVAAGLDIPVVGVVVGANPEERLNFYAPEGWQQRVTLVSSELEYSVPAPVTNIGDIKLDPIYEAKCLPYLQPGDLLWVVGNRNDLPQPAAAPANVPLKVSGKWAGKVIDCSVMGITRPGGCGAACCKIKGFYPASSGWAAGFEGCAHLGENGCTLSPEDKPLTCLLYPFTIKDQSMNLHGRALTGVCKPNYQVGDKTIAENIRANLVTVFGEQVADQIVAAGNSEKAIVVDIPESILAQLEREKEMEAANTIPVPRTQQPALPVRQAAAAAAPEYFVGDSLELLRTLPSPEGGYDFIFTCPPYGDLEVYSDDPADISNMEHGAFMQAYREIIRLAAEQLAPNRFAAIVVGDFRDKQGLYRNFVSDTIKAFLDAGLQLYNEGIFVTAVGSLPIRISGQFSGNRKLGKTHQNFLVFVKGDPAEAVKACGSITVDLPEGMLDSDGLADLL